MDTDRDIDIELYDLIFNARKDDDAIYNVMVVLNILEMLDKSTRNLWKLRNQ